MELSIEKIKKIEKKWQKEWEKKKAFEANVNKKRKFFITFPYPYVNGAPHVGHTFSFFRADSYARFKRLQGYNVLFPQGFHATGEPILGAIERLKENDEAQIETFKLFGATDKDIKNFIERGAEFTARYWMKKWIENLKKAGLSIDWRRTFITAITPHYNKFIEWQYNTLKKKGYVVQGTHPVVWCPHCQSPTGDHDRLKGEGESPIQFYIIKFKLESGEILPCATLRPETVFGVTNIWIKPNEEYLWIKIDNEVWLVSKKTEEKLRDQLRKVETIGKVNSNLLIGKYAENLITKEKVPILPADFIDLEVGTGIVMSVPAHAPYDYIALEDLKKDEEARKKFNLDKIVPKQIIEIEDYKGIPAEKACRDYDIKNQKETEKLELATQEVYKKEFHKGKMIVDPFKGLPVKDSKEKVVSLLKSLNALDYIWEITGIVICRCKTRCHVKILENQWFLKFSDEEWKNKVRKLVQKMIFYPEEIRQQFLNTIDWLENKACARKTGLGTKLPWDKEWIVETLSDSTIYMAFYTIYHILKKIPVEKIDDEIFDFIFLNKGNVKEIAKKHKINEKLLKEMRKEFEYFYPVDMRTSGKDLVQNHLTFYLFHHTAIWENEKYWPRAIAVNGFVNVGGEKMSKSKGNVIPLSRLLKDIGTDLTRINIISSAEDLSDADWRGENIKVFLSRINFVFEVIEKMKNAKSSELRNIDLFLESKINKIVKEAENAYEQLKFRTASQLLFFEFLNDLEWYLKRVGGIEKANKKILRYSLEKFVICVSPLIPHIAEELWKMLGNKNFVFEAGYPKIEKIDEKAIKREEFVNKVLEDIREIKKITQIQPKEAYIIVASDWKFEVFNMINKGVKLEEIIKKFEEKEEVAKFYNKIAQKTTEEIIGKREQLKILKEAKEFLEKEEKVKIFIVEEERTQIEKRKQATPLKPAIYFSS
ncbi:MAG: leucine--tRNA ligase [Candidatus Aenigmatarchaeota archaeon]